MEYLSEEDGKTVEDVRFLIIAEPLEKSDDVLFNQKEFTNIPLSKTQWQAFEDRPEIQQI